MRSLALAALIAPLAASLGHSSPRRRRIRGSEIGAVAPDFTLPGATRYGVLAHPSS